MYCKICGENCPDNAEFCTKCGQKLEKEVAYEAPVVNPAPVEEKKEGKGMGIASLILSIVSYRAKSAESSEISQTYFLNMLLQKYFGYIKHKVMM